MLNTELDEWMLLIGFIPSGSFLVSSMLNMLIVQSVNLLLFQCTFDTCKKRLFVKRNRYLNAP